MAYYTIESKYYDQKAEFLTLLRETFAKVEDLSIEGELHTRVKIIDPSKGIPIKSGNLEITWTPTENGFRLTRWEITL